MVHSCLDLGLVRQSIRGSGTSSSTWRVLDACVDLCSFQMRLEIALPQQCEP